MVMGNGGGKTIAGTFWRWKRLHATWAVSSEGNDPYRLVYLTVDRFAWSQA